MNGDWNSPSRVHPSSQSLFSSPLLFSPLSSFLSLLFCQITYQRSFISTRYVLLLLAENSQNTRGKNNASQNGIGSILLGDMLTRAAGIFGIGIGGRLQNAKRRVNRIPALPPPPPPRRRVPKGRTGASLSCRGCTTDVIYIYLSLDRHG